MIWTTILGWLVLSAVSTAIVCLLAHYAPELRDGKFYKRHTRKENND